ncbi:MAG: HEAT repeat domain-containing protein [Deltaproteobacteria bacterium]|nr:HEAT repeat domain-containing protein [Deltaproteobacteria bacterium]
MISRLSSLLASLLALTLIAGCSSPPPTTAEEWAKAIPELKREKEVKDAAEELRKLGAKDLREGKDLKPLVPTLIPLLQESYPARAAAAFLLGEIGDKAAVDPLLSAIDFSAAVSDKEASKANGRIADALGKLKDPKSVRTLLKLTKSRDNFTALAAVQALGEVGDPSALEPLMEIAEAEATDPFISKNAVQAMGKIGDPKAMPTLIHMLFIERRGVSFYRETSFAIFQVGADAIPELIDILDGKNKELMKWAEGQGVLEAGIYAKTAQLLGDLSDRRAIPSLRRRLKFDDTFADLKLLPPMFSAEALGRLRAKEAVGEISKMLEEKEANARGAYARALVMIGDQRGAQPLADSALEGFGYDAREEALWGYARLALKNATKTYDRIVEKNKDLKTCTAWFEGDKAAIEAECQKRIAKLEERAAKRRPMVVAADECGTDNACWVKKLKDLDGKVRERAGWALAQAADLQYLDDLLGAIQEDDLEARFAHINALDTTLFGDNDRVPEKAAAQKTVDRLNSVMEDEQGKAQFIKINEDVKRLALKVQRALDDAAKAAG